MRIYVTKDDIAHGIPCNSGKCPIALSLIRRFPKSFVTVGSTGVCIAESYHLPLPPVAVRFIQNFDSRPGKQKPFSFTLEV